VELLSQQKATESFEARLSLRNMSKKKGSGRFEVFTAVTMKNAVFWDVTPSGSCKNRPQRASVASYC
jgi:hypothetical protein